MGSFQDSQLRYCDVTAKDGNGDLVRRGWPNDLAGGILRTLGGLA